MFARERQRLPFPPHATNDGNRFLKCLDRFLWGQFPPTQSNDARPIPATPQSKFKTPTTEQTQCGRCFGKHRRWTQRQVGDIGEHMDPTRLAEQGSYHTHRVQELRNVGMILDSNEVEVTIFRSMNLVAQRFQACGLWGDEDPERKCIHERASSILIFLSRIRRCSCQRFIPVRSFHQYGTIRHLCASYLWHRRPKLEAIAGAMCYIPPSNLPYSIHRFQARNQEHHQCNRKTCRWCCN